MIEPPKMRTSSLGVPPVLVTCQPDRGRPAGQSNWIPSLGAVQQLRVGHDIPGQPPGSTRLFLNERLAGREPAGPDADLLEQLAKAAACW